MKGILFSFIVLAFSQNIYAHDTFPQPVCSEQILAIDSIGNCEHFGKRDLGVGSGIVSPSYKFSYIEIIKVDCVAYNGTHSAYEKKNIETESFSYSESDIDPDYPDENPKDESMESCNEIRDSIVRLKSLLTKN